MKEWQRRPLRTSVTAAGVAVATAALFLFAPLLVNLIRAATNSPPQISISGAVDNPLNLGGTDPTRSLRPRQQTSMFQIPNVFSRVTTLSVFPATQARGWAVPFILPRAPIVVDAVTD